MGRVGGGAGRKDRWEGLGGEQVGGVDGKGWGGSR